MTASPPSLDSSPEWNRYQFHLGHVPFRDHTQQEPAATGDGLDEQEHDQ